MTEPVADAGAPALDLSGPAPLRIHVVGIGGAGMSAIATVLRGMGHHVTGSDLKDSLGVERLRAQGITVAVGHDAANVGDAEVVTVSTAIHANNPEVVAATERGIPLLPRAATLSAICRTRRPVAVAGTHGKTTTSSMLALVLREAGLHPSFIIGGDLNEIGSGAVWDTGDLFVVEADESDGSFLALAPELAVVTNIEPDHLEHWGGLEALEAAFADFCRTAGRPPVLGADDPVCAALAAQLGAVTFGESPEATYRITALECRGDGSTFTLEHQGSPLGVVELPTPGAHNARNAAAALATAIEVGATFEAGARALARFAGVARRFEQRGKAAGITFIDDYAHLPSEVRAALAAARSGGWDRIVCVFQPHRYSRTATLWQDFADAFTDADLLVLTDIYPSGEMPRPGVSGRLIVRAVLDAHPATAVVYLPHRAELVSYLEARLRPGDLCLTLGAGDLTSLPDELLPRVGGGAAT